MVSIIIPIYNEEKNITALQKMLTSLQGEFEVIFCDGGSSDRTTSLIDPGYQLVSCEKGRAKQMNYGSTFAKGELLLFLHSDVFLQPEVLLDIPEEIRNGTKAGCYKIEFDCNHILMKICGMMSNLRVQARKIAYGDQGLLIQQELFERLGKMPDLPLMEDYEFSLQLKRAQIPIIQLDHKIRTSARRYQEMGMIRCMCLMKKLQRDYQKGRDICEIAGKYRDIR